MMALLHPQRVAALVLIGSGAALPVNAAIISGMDTNPHETTATITKWSWAKDTEDAIRVASHERLLRTPAAITRDDFIACDRFTIRERAATITAPALIMTGSVDRMTPLSMAQELAMLLPGATLMTLENGSHRVAQEQPYVILDRIQQWLANL
jgi:pimeloyl-ACP methyl ester carboxylesterase